MYWTRLLGRLAPIFYLNCEHVLFVNHKPSLWSRDVPQKFGPDRFSRFDVYWIQTDRQAKFIYRLWLLRSKDKNEAKM